MSAFIDSQRKRSAEALELWGKVYAKMKELGVPTKDVLPTQNMSIARINRALITRLEFLNSVRMSPTASEDILPENQSKAVLVALDSVKQQIASLANKLTALESAGGVQELSVSSLQVTARNGSTSDLSELNSLWSASTNALNAFLPLIPALGLGSTATMSSRATALQRLKAQTETILKSAENSLSQITKNLAEAESALKQTSDRAMKAEQLREKINTLAGEAQTLTGTATEKVAEIDQVVSRATELRTMVDEYKAQFSQFDARLTKRIENLETADVRTAEAEEANTAREREIDRLIEKSNSMIRGATVAGLAHSFNRLAEAYGRETRWARFAFYVSIAVLFVSLLPLAIYLVPGLSVVEDFELPRRLGQLLGDTTVSLPGIFGRLIILVPGTWLTGFCSRRYRRLFQLKETYSHKAALAQSLEGFKREAPQFQEEVVAAVFWDLTQYAQRERMNEKSDSADVPNPILRTLLSKLESSKD